MARQRISLEMTVKGFKKCCISSAVYGTDDMLWNGMRRIGMLGVSVRNTKALTLNVKTVTPIGKGRLNLTFSVY